MLDSVDCCGERESSNKTDDVLIPSAVTTRFREQKDTECSLFSYRRGFESDVGRARRSSTFIPGCLALSERLTRLVLPLMH